MNIALDVEGVLADSHGAAAEHSDMLTEETCPPPNWEFPSEEMFDEFMHATQNLWHNHNEDIDPMPQPEGWDLASATEKLSMFHDVDVVTNRSGVDEQIVEWLERHDIHHDTFHAIRGNKTGAGEHDVFIDDSPQVVSDALDVGAAAVLIDRPYNQSVESEDGMYRVSSVSAAAELLTYVKRPA